jgi:predicted helicase
LLTQFFNHTDEQIEEFHLAVREFENRIPDLARSLQERIADEPPLNPDFERAFNVFFESAKARSNPNIARGAVEEMLVQHLLTERLFSHRL